MISKLPAGIALVSHRSAIFVAASIAALILVAGSAAPAAGSAVCDQYPDLPQCSPTQVGGGGTGTETTGADGGASVSGSIPGGGDGDGGASAEAGKAADLPFTGYPLSPLVAVLLALLAAGIAIRVFLAIRRRLSVAPADRLI